MPLKDGRIKGIKETATMLCLLALVRCRVSFITRTFIVLSPLSITVKGLNNDAHLSFLYCMRAR